MSHPSYCPSFYHPNNIWQRIQSMKPFLVTFPPLPCYFLPLRFKYSLQHPVFRHLQSVYNFMYFNICFQWHKNHTIFTRSSIYIQLVICWSILILPLIESGGPMLSFSVISKKKKKATVTDFNTFYKLNVKILAYFYYCTRKWRSGYMFLKIDWFIWNSVQESTSGSCAELVESSLHPYNFKIHFGIILSSTHGSPGWSLHFGFSDRFCEHFSSASCMLDVLSISSLLIYPP